MTRIIRYDENQCSKKSEKQLKGTNIHQRRTREAVKLEMDRASTREEKSGRDHPEQSSKHHPEQSSEQSRLTPKNVFLTVLSEFLGTVLFLWIAFAGTSSALYQVSGGVGTSVLFIALIFGFAFAIAVWIFFRGSGGLFNPAITLALMLFGFIPLITGIFLIVAQFAGAIVAAALVEVMIYPIPLLANTSLLPLLRPVRGMFIEAIVTAFLILAAFLLVTERSKATFLAPVGIGLALFVSELASIFFTGGSLNPARSLGPAILTDFYPDYFWIYFVGPLLGALIASAIYPLLRELKYQRALPNQDSDVAQRRKGEEKEMEGYDNV